jgi:F-type H+-transporting ATPase subunit epsilon
MLLDVLTPDKKVFSGEVISVVVPGTDGSFEVLNKHAAIISTLGKGDVVIREASGTKSFLIEGGVVEVIDNKVIVLAETILS